MRHKNLLAISAVLITHTACVHQDKSDKLMDVIEAQLALPAGASSINQYRRHYSWADANQTSVRAVYERGGKPAKLWLPAEEMPIILDGGCGVITFSYDVITKKFKNVVCNGDS